MEKHADMFAGIPNENSIPHLHTITSRKMAVLQNPDLLQYCQVNKSTLNDIFGSSQESSELTALKQELN